MNKSTSSPKRLRQKGIQSELHGYLIAYINESSDTRLYVCKSQRHRNKTKFSFHKEIQYALPYFSYETALNELRLAKLSYRKRKYVIVIPYTFVKCENSMDCNEQAVDVLLGKRYCKFCYRVWRRTNPPYVHDNIQALETAEKERKTRREGL